MGWFARWAEYRQWRRGQRARQRGRTFRLTFQKCRRCKRSALLPITPGKLPICGSCSNQQ